MVDKKIEEDESNLSTSSRILANLARRAQEPGTGQIRSRGSGRFASSRQGRGVDPFAKSAGFLTSVGTARTLGAREDARIRSEVGTEEKRLDRLAADETRESSIANVQSQIQRRLAQTEGEEDERNLALGASEESTRQFNVREERLGAGAKVQEQLSQLDVFSKEIGVAQKLNLPIKKESPVGKAFGLAQDVSPPERDLTRRQIEQGKVLEDSISDIRIKQEDFQTLTSDEENRLLEVVNQKRAIVGLQPVTLGASAEAEPETTPTPESTPIPQNQRDAIKRALIEQRNSRLGQ